MSMPVCEWVGYNAHIPTALGAAVHAAYTARDERLDPDRGRNHHRAGDRRAAVAAQSERRRQITPGHLDCLPRRIGVREAVQLCLRQADVDASIAQRDGGRHGAVRADDALERERRRQVRRVRHACGGSATGRRCRELPTMRHDRRLERDHRRARLERMLDLVGHYQSSVLLSAGRVAVGPAHPSCARGRQCACTARAEWQTRYHPGKRSQHVVRKSQGMSDGGGEGRDQSQMAGWNATS